MDDEKPNQLTEAKKESLRNMKKLKKKKEEVKE